jgi:SAM-dependent methyltransferase
MHFSFENSIRMLTSHPVLKFKTHIESAIEQKSFLKVSLGNYKGSEAGLKNVYVRPVQIKRQEMLSFTYRYRTRDIVKNYAVPEGVELVLEQLQEGFKVATLFTSEFDFILQQDRDGLFRLSSTKATLKPTALGHDKVKPRPLASQGKAYLHALKITDAAGIVFKNAQDKFKQINHYIDLLSPMLKTLPVAEIRNVVDMGSGKGYLTFALYDYLHSVLQIDARVTGVEFREDLVQLCNGIAKDSLFDKLNFVQGTIDDYNSTSIDLLIALHACDTATDDAISKGIKGDAKLIVVAPCCHKQIRKEMTRGKRESALGFLLEHGIFFERQAEMVTDGLRVLIMEYFGYKTKAIQFISDAHTAKNVMLIGVKQPVTSLRKQQVLKEIKETKEFFGIEYHHLERLMGLQPESVNLS